MRNEKKKKKQTRESSSVYTTERTKNTHCIVWNYEQVKYTRQKAGMHLSKEERREKWKQNHCEWKQELERLETNTVS